MYVTLEDISRAKQQKKKNILKMKSDLIYYKKKGFVFFDENIAGLEKEDPFSLYYFQTPNPQSPLNAFPVPVEEIQFSKCCSEQKRYFKEYFESYYGKGTWNEQLYEKYFSSPYVGEHYAWYYKAS